MAVSGMSPSACVRGILRMPAGMPLALTVFEPHAVLTVKMRRHRPSWMTTGMVAPTGTFVRVKVPSYFVVACTSGLPETSAPQVLHCWACVSEARGMKASTYGADVRFGM